MKRTLAVTLLLFFVSGPARSEKFQEPWATGRYPMDVSVTFSSALFHWIDSLAGLESRGGPGLTGGKTIAVHRQAHDNRYGTPTAEDSQMLSRFGNVRLEFMRSRMASDGDAFELLLAFFEHPTLDSALTRAMGLLSDDRHQSLFLAMHHFAPRYRPIWRGGRIPLRFLEATDGKNLKKLEKLLAGIARFYGVDPSSIGRPHLVLVPVGDRNGTHAQAFGRHLLIELRSSDDLASTASVIVHENAHYLFANAPERLRSMLRDAAAGAGSTEAHRVLLEALPTALGQGVAGRTFFEDWTTEVPWYNREDVDRYAKALFPLVSATIKRGGRLDEAFARQAFELWKP